MKKFKQIETSFQEMKKRFSAFAFVFLTCWLLSFTAKAQVFCIGSSLAGNITGYTNSYQPMPSVAAGQAYYWTTTLAAGVPYTWSNCPAEGGTSSDTYLRIYDAANTLVASADDICGANAMVSYTPAVGGLYYVHLAQYSCGTLSTSQVIAYRAVLPPTIVSFTPASGCPGTSVVITGTNFTGASAVTFGGTPAASFVVNSPTQITAITGAGTTGTIAVVNGGTGTSVGIHTISPAPVAPTPVTATPSTICVGASSNLNGTSAGNNISWFTAPSGGVAVGTSPSGVNFSVTPAVTTIYYAEATPISGNALAVGTVVQGALVLNGAGTTPMGVVWNPQFSMYYAVAGGNPSVPLVTYNAAGVQQSNVAGNLDFRGSWWNSNTNKFEGNSYGPTGYRANDLNGSGWALGSGVVAPAGQLQPNAQSQGGYDPINNETVFYNGGQIERRNRTTGVVVASGTITGLPGGNINQYWTSYSGVPGAEIMIYDYTNRAVRCINRLTFAYTSSVQLANTAPQPATWSVGYDGNGKLWLHNGASWINYPIIIVGGGGVPGSQVFAYTGAAQTFTVPAGVTSVTIDAKGAQGAGGNGGNGGTAVGTLAVVPGQVLNIYVGGQTAAVNAAAFNGGGIGHAVNARNGGGASDVRVGGIALANRVIVAGGGGSSSGDANSPGGTGGGGTAVGLNFVGGGGGLGYGGAGGAGGTNGGTGNVSTHSGGAGGGGLNSGGSPSCNTGYGNTCGTAGTLGVGGNGDLWENGICYNSYGGTSGGGGGYYGGGGTSVGNCGGGGGGGGSSWTGSLTSPSFTAGNRAGNGQVTINWVVVPLTCPSPTRTPVTVVVNPIAAAPSPVTATPASICLGATSQLNSTGAALSTQTWYTQLSGGVAIGTSLSGVDFPVSPAVTTTYYVETTNNIPGGTQTFNYTGSLQTFTVPAGITSLTMDVRGAQGGTGLGVGGNGARMQGALAVIPGQVLSILVGQKPANNGGGGGTFVMAAGNVPQMIAGAGGGGAGSCCGNVNNGQPGVTATSGTAGVNAGGGTGVGGVGGNGGQGFLQGQSSGAGGGLLTSGGNGDGGALGGQSFLLGGAGGAANNFGGYGGGGSSHCVGAAPNGCAGGGGGGYSGGGNSGGGPEWGGGGGGGSYSIAASQVNTSGFQTGNGQVIITWAGNVSCASTPRVPVTVTVNSVSATPSPVTATPAAICPGATSQLNSTAAVGNIQSWYTVPNGGVAIGTTVSGGNLAVTPAVTTTYYAENQDAGVMGGTQTFNFTGGVQTFTVPAGVTTLTVDAFGAQGGANYVPSVGGLGGRMQSTVTVVPGAVLNVYVGGAGVIGINAGGYNGGGASSNNTNSGSGGGASDIRVAPYALANRLVVAGAGAGAGLNCASNMEMGGVGGGLTGGTGWQCNQQVSYVGTGGSQIAGGIAGNNQGQGCGTNGALGLGGNGACTYGGGGGGGYYGGGGGGYGGGGGGSSFSSGAILTNTQGVRVGNGQVIITWVGGGLPCPSVRVPVTVTVNPLPAVTASASPAAICAGGSSVLSGGGANTYLWNPGALVGSPTVTPAITTTYTVTGTSVDGCTSSTTVTVTINPNPSVTASASPAAICPGGSSILTGGGAATYAWNPGALVGSPTVTPGATTTYSVVGTDGNGCTGATTVTVTVNLSPVVTASASPASICVGDASVLTGGGATTYAWDPGALVGSPTVTPGATTAYTVTGTDGAGCTGTSVTTVTVNTGTAINVTASVNPICEGSSTVLTATGLPGNGIDQSQAITNTCMANFNQGDLAQSFIPGVNTICGAGVFIDNGGSGTVTIELRTALPPAGVSLGSGSAIGNAGSYVDVTWPSVPVSIGTTYYLILTSSNGNQCVAGNTSGGYANGQLYANTGFLPFPGFDYTFRTASCGGSYVYNPGNLAGGVQTVSPVATTTYTVTGTNASGCTATTTLTINVNTNPVVTASASPATICEGLTSMLMGSGAATYLWNPGALVGMPTVTPLATTTYSVTGTDGNGCTGTTEVTVTVLAAPIVTATATPSTTCNLTSVTPIGGGAATYAWTGGVFNNVPFIATATTTYTVTGTDGFGCDGTTTVMVTVNPMSGLLAPATTSQTQVHGDDFNINYYDISCDLIATVDDGAGGNVLGSTISTVTVDATAGNHNGQPFVRRWYQITPTSIGGADVILYFNQSDFTDYNAAVALPYLPLPTSGNNLDPNIGNIRITKNADAGLGNLPIVITPSSVNWNGTYWELTFNTPGFSQFRVHSVNANNAPLPASVTNFSGLKLESSDKLSWTTSSEQNNAYFNLQHSTDGTNFTTLARVDSKAPNGNSAVSINYSSINAQPNLGHNYYRLQNVDVDSKVSVHAEIVDLIWGANGSTVSIYPNPTTDILNIDLYVSKAQNTTVKLLDMSGRVIKQIQAKSAVGMNNIKLSMGEIASGVYTIQVYENNNLTHTSKVKKND